MLVILVLQSKGQIPGDSPPDPSHFVRNGSSPGSNFTGKLDDNHTSAAASGALDQAETNHVASGCYKSAETPANITSMIDGSHMILHYSQKYFLRLEAALVTYDSSLYVDNAISQSQSQRTGPSPVDDSAVKSEMLNSQELAIDEGMISVSSTYSQE